MKDKYQMQNVRLSDAIFQQQNPKGPISSFIIPSVVLPSDLSGLSLPQRHNKGWILYYFISSQMELGFVGYFVRYFGEGYAVFDRSIINMSVLFLQRKDKPIQK